MLNQTNIQNLESQLLESLKIGAEAGIDASSASSWAIGVMLAYDVDHCPYDDDEDTLHSVLERAAYEYWSQLSTNSIKIAAQWLEAALSWWEEEEHA